MMITHWKLPRRLSLLCCIAALVGSCGTDGLRDRLSRYNDELKRTEGYSWALHDSLLAVYSAVVSAEDPHLDSAYNDIVYNLLSRARTSQADHIMASYQFLRQGEPLTEKGVSGVSIAQLHRLGLKTTRSRSALLSELWYGPSTYSAGDLCGNLAMAYMRQGLFDVADSAAALTFTSYEGMYDWRGQKWPLRLQYTIAMKQGRKREAETYLRRFNTSFEQYILANLEDGYTTSINLAHDVLQFPDSTIHMKLAFGAAAPKIRYMYDSLVQSGAQPWLIGRTILKVDSSTVYPTPIVRLIRDDHTTLLAADSVTWDSQGTSFLHTALGIYRGHGLGWKLLTVLSDRDTSTTRYSQQWEILTNSSIVRHFSNPIEYIGSLGGDSIMVATSDSLMLLTTTSQRGILRRQVLPRSLSQAHIRRLDDSLLLLISDNGVDILSTDLSQHKDVSLSFGGPASRSWADLLVMRVYDSRKLGPCQFALSIGPASGIFSFEPSTRQFVSDSINTIPTFRPWDELDPMCKSVVGSSLIQFYWSRPNESVTAVSEVLMGARWSGQDWAPTSAIGIPTISEPYALLVHGTSALAIDPIRNRCLPIENLPVLTYAEKGRYASLTRPMTVSCDQQPTIFFADGSNLYKQPVTTSWMPLQPKLVVENNTAGTIDTLEIRKGHSTIELRRGHQYQVYLGSITPSFGYSMVPDRNGALAADIRPTYFQSPSTQILVASFMATLEFTQEDIWIPFTASTITFLPFTPFYEQSWFLGTIVATGVASFIFTLLTLYRNTARKRADAIEQAKQEQLAALREDMHDMIGSRLSRIASLTRQRDGKEVASQLDKIQEIALTTVRSLRNLLSLMAEANLTDPEFFGTIKEFMVGACQDARVECIARVTLDDQSNLSSEDRHQLLMICSELVTNSIRHAQCTHTWLTISSAGTGYDIVWEDDGVGIDPTKPRGHGLNNIQRRCARIGADVSFVQRQPHGTSVLIRVATTKGVA